MSKSTHTNPVKLLHIVGDSKFGGGSLVILRLAVMAQQQMGWQVDVLTTDKVLQKLLVEQGIGVVELDVIWRNIRPARDLAGLFRLRSFLRRSGYDIVHTHTSKAGFVGRLAARAAGIRRIVHTVHGFAFHEESTRAALCIYSLLERIAAHACDRIVTVSEFHRQWALKLGIGSAEKIITVHNGVHTDRVQPKRDREVVRNELGVNSGTHLLLTTGRLAEQKGFEDLIHALPDIAKGLNIPFQLVLAGTGPLEPMLKRLASDLGVQDRVRFLGFRPDIGDLLAASDMVVLPTMREGLSIALLEAMAAGKPIVTTRIGSNAEAACDGLGAKLVPPNDSNALAAAVIHLAENRLRADTMGRKAKEIFAQNYTEDRMLGGYRSLYRTLLLSPETNPREIGAYLQS